MIVVADTGPILHLHEANALELLQHVGDCHIPLAVNAECQAHIPGWRSPRWLTIDVLNQPATEEYRQWLVAGLLDEGEAQSIALARQLSASWFITDDTAARVIAQTLGFETHGSLGIVLWAAATGVLKQVAAEETLDRLSKSSLWVSARVLREAQSALSQIFHP